MDHGGCRPEVGQCDRDNAGVRGIDPAGQHTSNRDSDQQAERGVHADPPVQLRAHARADLGAQGQGRDGEKERLQGGGEGLL